MLKILYPRQGTIVYLFTCFSNIMNSGIHLYKYFFLNDFSAFHHLGFLPNLNNYHCLACILFLITILQQICSLAFKWNYGNFYFFRLDLNLHSLHEKLAYKFGHHHQNHWQFLYHWFTIFLVHKSCKDCQVLLVVKSWSCLEIKSELFHHLILYFG